MTRLHALSATLLALALLPTRPGDAATAQAANLQTGQPGPTAAAAAPAVAAVRVGDHKGFGRIVFDLPEGARVHTVHEGDRLLIVFEGAGPAGPAPRPPRNVASMRFAPRAAVLQLAPGTRPHLMRLGQRLVVDVLDHAMPRVEPAPEPHAGAASAPHLAPPMVTTTQAPVQVPAQPTPPNVAAPAPVVAPPPTPVAAPTPAPTPAPPAAAEATPTQATSAPPKDSRAAPPNSSPTAPSPGSAPVVDVAQAALPPPANPAAARNPTPASARPASPETPAWLVPVDRDVAAAAFPRDGNAVIVLDRRVPKPATGLVLPAAATWTEGPVSTTIVLPLDPDHELRLARLRHGWSIQPVTHPLAASSGGASPAPMPAIAEPPLGKAATQAADHPTPTPPTPTPPTPTPPAPRIDETMLPIAHPGRTVTIIDPLTGGTLLVGTSRTADPGSFVAQPRRTPNARVLPTWLGVAVAPIADRVDLRALEAGFVLTGAPSLAAITSTSQTRRFDFPGDSAQTLLNRLHAQLASAADTAIRSRTQDRLAAAQTMLALGMGAEAEALTRLVAAQDPQAANDASLVGLQAIAAVMAGRPAEATGLDDPRLAGTDEIALWRGLRDHELGHETSAARGIDAYVPLATAYPPTLRRLVWPAVAETAVQAGFPVPDQELTPFARALRLQHDGKVDAALAAYDAMAAGPDRLLQVRAATRAIELRLAAGRIHPADAATQLERQAFVWRDSLREPRLRLRAAQLRAAAGQWRVALDGLRDVETLFPSWKPQVHAAKAAVMQAMLATDGGGMTPLNLVLLAAADADGLPSGPEGNALARLLVEKLLALDLPARAIPLLHGLMQAAPPGPARAEVGARLAQLLLDGADPAAARTALGASAAKGLSPALTQRRAFLLARIQAKQGQSSQAAAGLAEIGTEAADDLRASLLANAGDWRGSLQALTALAAKQVPPDGPLSDAAQEVLLREATAAARIPDPAALQRLAPAVSRMSPQRADLFRVLTAAPLASADDLPRAARELKMARMLPEQVQSLGNR